MTLTGTLNEGSTLHADSAGILEIPVNQTVATLEGTDNAASVDIASSKVLTLNGVDGETVYDGSLTGSGTLVKKGTDYALVFDGSHTTNHPFAGNVRIDEGALSLKKDKTFTETVTPTRYWSFDDPDNPGAPDVESLSFKSYTWNNGHVASDVNLSAPGVRGKGVRPNGTVFLSTGNIGVMPREANAFSILVWAKIDADATGSAQLLGWGNKTITRGSACRLLVNGSGAAEVHSTYGTHLEIKSGESVSYRDGRWHQYALVYEGSSTSNLTLYVDGVSVGSSEILFAIPNYCYFDLGLTSVGSSGSRTPCNVALDELGVYRYTALTAEQIAACYGQFRSRAMEEVEPTALPSPVAWYRFDDEANVGKDSSGNGYHLTAYAGGASGGSTMKAPTVDLHSPIHGGMYNSRDGSGYLKWADATLPIGIPAKTEPMTVSLWFNASGSLIQSASQSWAVFQLGSIRLGSYFDDPFRRFALMTANKTVASYSPLQFIQTMERATAWHHAAYVSTGSDYKFYVDGKLVYTKTGSVISYSDTSVFIIGQAENTLNEKWQFFRGNLDEVKIYAAALTDEQIVADYMSELPRTGGVVDPASSYEVQAGAKLVVDGATQAFEGGIAGSGSVELRNDARLTLGGSTFAGSLYGVGSVAVNDNLTLSGDMEFGPSSSVEVTNAVLTVAQGGTLAAPVVLRADGKLSAAGAVDADVTVKEGGCLDFASPLTTTGVLALEPGFVVDCGGNEYRTWTTIATASKVEATQAVLDSVVFENKTQNAVGVLRLVDGTTLQARCCPAKGFTIVVQ